MNIEDVMSTDMIVGYVPGTVKDALTTLAKHNVSGMPILKRDTKTVVGVVTRQDIFRNPEEEQLALVMSPDVQTVDKDQKVEDAARLLFEHRFHGLPVVNKKQQLVGIISPTHILKAMFKSIQCPVKEFTTNLVVPIYKETPINVVMEIINITHENALPVINDDLKVMGIVSDGDLFKLSHIKESVSATHMGMGGDEDQWTWEGIRDTMRIHFATSEVSLPSVPVHEVMVKNVVTGMKNTPVAEIAQSMIKHDISHIPIVDSGDRLIGMVSDIDLMACIL